MSGKHDLTRSHEPIFWGLFGAGGMWLALVAPMLVLLTGILVPMGILDGDLMGYARMHDFASTWYGFIGLLVIICLPLWHTLHRIYHGLHDLGVHWQPDLQQVFCYGFAFAVTVFCFTLLLLV